MGSKSPQQRITENPSVSMFVVGVALIVVAVLTRATPALAAPLAAVGAAAALFAPFAERLEGRFKAGPGEANLATIGEKTIDDRIDKRL